MHRMQSGGWPYSEDGRDSSKAPSLRVAVLRTAVFHSLRSNQRTVCFQAKICILFSSIDMPHLNDTLGINVYQRVGRLSM